MSFNPQPTLADLTITGSISGLDETVMLDLNGTSGGKMVISGTWVGTIKFEGSIDGTRWDNVGAFDGTNGAVLSATGTTSNTVIVLVGIAGLSQVRARFHAYTSGTATVTIRASNGVSNIFADNLIASNFKTQSNLHDGSGNAISSVNNKLQVSNISNNGGTQGVLVVGTTAVEAKVGASAFTNRIGLTVYNDSGVTIYWGYTSGVTTATGTPIEKKQLGSWAVGPSTTVYLIAGSANNNVRITENA